MKKGVLTLISAAAIAITGCSTTKLPAQYESDFSTSGVLGNDCFQVIIKMEPEKNSKTMHDRRISAYIKAKENIINEAEKQIISYYTSLVKAVKDENIGSDKIKKRAADYARKGKLEQEFYLDDDSVILIYRIYKKDIKNEILNN